MIDISCSEQARRLRERRRDPLKQWKMSPVDAAAQRHWRAPIYKAVVGRQNRG